MVSKVALDSKWQSLYYFVQITGKSTHASGPDYQVAAVRTQHREAQ